MKFLRCKVNAVLKKIRFACAWVKIVGMKENTRKTFILTTLILHLFTLVFSAPSPAQENTLEKVVVARVEGVIVPANASYFKKALEKAEKESALLLVEIDTPGGLDETMRDMIKEILNSKVPVAVFVTPSGARAASAGCYVLIASHIAAMSPGTNTGAASPVSMGAGEAQPDETLKRKVINDAAAYIRSLARMRGRNEDWAEEAVRKGSSLTAEKALELRVIDFLAKDRAELLKKIDGMKVKAGEIEWVLKTDGAQVEEFPMGWIDRLLLALSNPNLAYLLLTIGFYGLIYEFANPGIGFSGIAGAICIILALYSLQVLSINYAGLALIILGLILFVAEAFTPTFGLLAGGGLISFIIGSLLLIESPIAQLKISLLVIAPVAIVSMLLILAIARTAIQAQRKKAISGKEGMVGLEGEAYTDLDPEGTVFVRGELWQAESLEGKIEKGEKIVVENIEGLKLKVKRR